MNFIFLIGAKGVQVLSFAEGAQMPWTGCDSTPLIGRFSFCGPGTTLGVQDTKSHAKLSPNLEKFVFCWGNHHVFRAVSMKYIVNNFKVISMAHWGGIAKHLGRVKRHWGGNNT